jgi:hypothetical protein
MNLLDALATLQSLHIIPQGIRCYIQERSTPPRLHNLVKLNCASNDYFHRRLLLAAPSLRNAKIVNLDEGSCQREMSARKAL